MKIKEGLCIGCGNCVLICPTNAIKMIENKAIINDTKINEDIKNERVLSAIIEFKIPHEKIDGVIKVIREVEKRLIQYSLLELYHAF